MEKIKHDFSWIDSAYISTREIIVEDDNGNTMSFDEQDLLVMLSCLVRRKRDLQ